MYRHYTEDGRLSIERETKNTPKDKKYYVIKDRVLVYSTVSLKEAQKIFNELKPPKSSPQKKQIDKEKRLSDEIIRNTASAKEEYWHYSHQFRRGRPKR